MVARPLAARKGVKLKVGGGAVVEGDSIEAAASALAVARRVDVAIIADTGMKVFSSCEQEPKSRIV